jgi:hypothetical protein
MMDMQQPVQLNPTDQVAVTLEAQAWNQVLMIISEAPWKIAAPLIEAIRGQCMRHERREIDASLPAKTD